MLSCSPCTITALICCSGIAWLYTAVYASPQANVRQHLWPYLDSALQHAQLPWLFAGVFNEIISHLERRGSTTPLQATGLRDWLKRNSLVDLGYIGPDYTWMCSPNSAETLWERLDRAVSNISWRTSFPEAYIRHLPRLHSEHNPLHLTLTSRMHPRQLPKHFRYQTMWTSHVNFQHVVSSY